MFLLKSEELEPGTVVEGKYRIERLVGRGGMGFVYLATDMFLEQRRALKFLASRMAADPQFVRRFLREARAAGKVDQANVVRIFGLEQRSDGSFFLTMEYVGGPGLRQLLESHPHGLPIPRAFALVRGIAEGLRAAHAVSLVHRDIKPENILLSSAAEHAIPKIVDFGIVARTDDKERGSITGRPILTPEYASPEQFRGIPPAIDLDGRTDLYALGVVFFELLTGRLPFKPAANARSTYEGWLDLHCTAKPPKPSSLRPELAAFPGLDELVLRLLAKEREQRPDSAADVIRLLDATQHVPVLPRRETVPEEPLRRARTVPEEPATLPTPTPEPENRVRPNIEPADSGARKSDLGDAVARMFLWAAFLVIVVIIIAVSLNNGWQSQSSTGYTDSPSDYDQARTAMDRHDYTGAVALYSKSCDGGRAIACEKLGDMYGIGIGVPKDANRWASYYGKACDLDEKYKCTMIGVALYNATGVPRDYRMAAAFFQKACDDGEPDGCNWLGYVYENGHGVRPNLSKAAAMYTKACDAGTASGCNNLGNLYVGGSGVPQDLAKADALYSKACDGDIAQACSSLGDSYHNGDGVEKDLGKAKQFLTKGCNMGNQWGCDKLKALQ
jgi:TPR repeat protein